MTDIKQLLSAASSRGPSYRTVWRWHFYAGLFCIPFVLWLASTGSIYLFKPQIDAWLERSYENLPLSGRPASPQAQVAAALAAVPGSVLNAYELPRTPQSAVRVLAGRGGEITRVYVHPQTLQMLGQVREESRFTRLIFHLHGELLLGTRGSMLVELAASWAIVMILSGLFLWWPRHAEGLAGVVYPRLHRGGRSFWRDLHAVIGLWVSAFALFLLISGLPWATFWGNNLKLLRSYGAPAAMQQDWSTGSDSDRARAMAQNTQGDQGEHAGHDMNMPGMPAMAMEASFDGDALDRLVPVVAALHLPPPVLIAPPSAATAHWSARSDTQNRPRRVMLELDGEHGAVTRRVDFRDRPLLDRIIGTGVAAHEGQLFGWFNQLLGVLTALGLITLSLSALAMWWQRRPAGVLGAPPPSSGRPRGAAAFVVLAVVLGVLLPLLGVSLLAVLLAERLLLKRIPAARDFLGLVA